MEQITPDIVKDTTEHGRIIYRSFKLSPRQFAVVADIAGNKRTKTFKSKEAANTAIVDALIKGDDQVKVIKNDTMFMCFVDHAGNEFVFDSVMYNIRNR